VKLVVTHAQPDFDAIASLALALRVHPDSVAALHGSLPSGVAKVVAQYRDRLRLIDVAAVDLAAVVALIVVDTADRRRLGPFEALLGRCPVTLYDHHPAPEAPIAAASGLVEPVGATVTLLLRILQGRGAELPPEIASLALLGLHEDTGGFRYASTTGADHEAAALLHRSGGNLRLVRELLEERDADGQRAFGTRVERETDLRTVAGRTVAVAAFDHGPYLADVAPWANAMLVRTGAAAALLSVEMEGQTLLFARSNGLFDVAAAVREALGGGGHPGAAFARCELTPGAALERALAALERHGTVVLRATDLMNGPVKSVPADATVAEALGLLLRFGHNGLPVLSEDDLVGMVSRRDLDRALRHGLESRPVSQIMRSPVVTATPDTPLAELEALVQERGVGRIPVVEGGDLLGIVTRTDLLAARHPERSDPGPAERTLGRFPRGALDLLDALATTVRELGGAAYLVGGTVRDGLLGSGLHDLDASIEGVAVVDVAHRLQRSQGGSVGCHADFGTCTLSLPSGLVLDLAETRAEYYRSPGALPSVAPSGMVQDLARRDFTVNALALRLEPTPRTLIDPYGGRDDLDRRLLRSLHPLSFREDPTRLLRGARLAARLGLAFEAATETQALQAVDDGVLASVSASRLRHELELTLAEAEVAPALDLLAKLGAVESGFGLPLPSELIGALDRLRSDGRSVPGRSYLLALLATADADAAEQHVERFHWPRRVLGVRRALLAAANAPTLTDEALEALGVPGRALLEALAPQHAGRVRSFESPPYRRRVRGRDVIDLGLPPGPNVGAVLRDIDLARAEGRVASFDDEIDLARRLVAALDAGAELE
jgi:tRNA nucleotidyltransferase (CCA-adding enzyme)